jgi:hypothetical protein
MADKLWVNSVTYPANLKVDFGLSVASHPAILVIPMSGSVLRRASLCFLR